MLVLTRVTPEELVMLASILLVNKFMHEYPILKKEMSIVCLYKDTESSWREVRLEVQSDLIVAALLCDPDRGSQLTSVDQLNQSTVSLFTHAGRPREIEPNLCVWVGG